MARHLLRRLESTQLDKHSAEMNNLYLILAGLMLALTGCEQSPPFSNEAPPEVISEDEITIGMSRDEVEARFGPPSQITVDAKGNDLLTYLVNSKRLSEGEQLGGLIVVISSGSVAEVRPIYVHRRQY